MTGLDANAMIHVPLDVPMRTFASLGWRQCTRVPSAKVVMVILLPTKLEGTSINVRLPKKTVPCPKIS